MGAIVPLWHISSAQWRVLEIAAVHPYATVAQIALSAACVPDCLSESTVRRALGRAVRVGLLQREPGPGGCYGPYPSAVSSFSDAIFDEFVRTTLPRSWPKYRVRRVRKRARERLEMYAVGCERLAVACMTGAETRAALDDHAKSWLDRHTIACEMLALHWPLEVGRRARYR